MLLLLRYEIKVLQLCNSYPERNLRTSHNLKMQLEFFLLHSSFLFFGNIQCLWMFFLNLVLYQSKFSFAFKRFQITHSNNQNQVMNTAISCFPNSQILKLLDTSCNCLKSGISHFCKNVTTISSSSSILEPSSIFQVSLLMYFL